MLSLSLSPLTNLLFLFSFLTGFAAFRLVWGGLEKFAVAAFLASGSTMVVAIVFVIADPAPAISLFGSELLTFFVFFILLGYGLGATIACGIVVPLRFALQSRKRRSN